VESSREVRRIVAATWEVVEARPDRGFGRDEKQEQREA